MKFRVLGVFALLALLVGQVALANIPTPGLAPKMYANPGGAWSVAVDSQGNIIEGRRGGSVTTGVVVKLSRDGAQLWQHDFGSGSGTPAVAVDSHDNVLAVPAFLGTLFQLAPGDGAVTRSTLIPGVRPIVSNIVVDASDGVLFAGTVWTSTQGQISKVDAVGLGLWSRQTPMVLGDNSIDISATRDGGAVVTTSRGTAKYDAVGNQQWAVGIGGSGVAADDVGNVYVTFALFDAPRFVAKLDPSGNLLWRLAEAGNKVRLIDGTPVVVHAYPAGVGAYPQAYVNVFEVSAFNPTDGKWLWGFKHLSGFGYSVGALTDFYVRPGYIAFTNAETDSALYAGSWLAAVCDNAANPPSALFSLARACVFTPV